MARRFADFSSRFAPRRVLLSARSASTPRRNAQATKRVRTAQLPGKPASRCVGRGAAVCARGACAAADWLATGPARVWRAFSRLRRLRSRFAVRLRRCRGSDGFSVAHGCGGAGGAVSGSRGSTGAALRGASRASRSHRRESVPGNGGGGSSRCGSNGTYESWAHKSSLPASLAVSSSSQ